MLRPLLIVGAVGVGGYVIWQLVWAFILPMLAGILGLLWMAVKIGLLVLAAYFVYRMFVKAATKASPPPNSAVSTAPHPRRRGGDAGAYAFGARLTPPLTGGLPRPLFYHRSRTPWPCHPDRITARRLHGRHPGTPHGFAGRQV
jgi:hypothetical protein